MKLVAAKPRQRATLTLHIARQVVGTLARAHGMGIIYCDLKPENIMLVSRDGDDSVATVLDFGMAKLSAQTASCSRV